MGAAVAHLVRVDVLGLHLLHQLPKDVCVLGHAGQGLRRHARGELALARRQLHQRVEVRAQHVRVVVGERRQQACERLRLGRACRRRGLFEDVQHGFRCLLPLLHSELLQQLPALRVQLGVLRLQREVHQLLCERLERDPRRLVQDLLRERHQVGPKLRWGGRVRSWRRLRLLARRRRRRRRSGQSVQRAKSRVHHKCAFRRLELVRQQIRKEAEHLHLDVDVAPAAAAAAALLSGTQLLSGVELLRQPPRVIDHLLRVVGESLGYAARSKVAARMGSRTGSGLDQAHLSRDLAQGRVVAAVKQQIIDLPPVALQRHHRHRQRRRCTGQQARGEGVSTVAASKGTAEGADSATTGRS